MRALSTIFVDTGLWFLCSLAVGGSIAPIHNKNINNPLEDEHTPNSFFTVDGQVCLVALLTSFLIAVTFPYSMKEIQSVLAREWGATEQKPAAGVTLDLLQAVVLVFFLLVSGAGGQLDWQHPLLFYPYSTGMVYLAVFIISSVVKRLLRWVSRKRKGE